MNELENARKIINEADKKIAELFEERMKAAEQIAKYKRAHGLSVLDTSRERELIARNGEYRSNLSKLYFQMEKHS